MDCRSTNISHQCEKNQTFFHHSAKSHAKQYVESESLQGLECGGSCVFYFRNKIIFSGPKLRQSEDVSRRNYAKSIENDAMFKISGFNRRIEQIGSDYSTFPTCEAMVLLVIWPPVWQVNNADEEKGRKRRQVRLQPLGNK